QRLLSERLRYQRTQPAVDWLVHAEHDPFAQHRAERGDDGRRRERLVVAQHPRQFGVRVSHVTGDRVVEGAEVVQVVEKLFHLYPSFPFSPWRRRAANDAKRCNTGAGRTRAANSTPFWVRWAKVNGHAPSRIEPCLGMPSTIRDMWCMPEAGRILLDTNSIEASGPTRRRRNGPRSSSALSRPSVNRSGGLASFIANLPRVFMVLSSRA